MERDLIKIDKPAVLPLIHRPYYSIPCIASEYLNMSTELGLFFLALLGVCIFCVVSLKVVLWISFKIERYEALKLMERKIERYEALTLMKNRETPVSLRRVFGRKNRL